MGSYAINKMKSMMVCLAMGMLAAMISGCPVSSKARVSFVAVPDIGYAALTVNFQAAVQALPPYILEDKFRGDGIPRLTVISYIWTFGDGSTGSGAHPVHIYYNPGTYTVSLRALVREEDTGTTSMTPPFYGKVVVLSPNTPPVANAGPDQTRRLGQQVQLDGSASYDIDGDELTYAWSFVSVPQGIRNSTAQLNDPAAVRPTFAIDQPGQYVLSLTVNDGKADSEPDLVTISTVNSPPVADAGPDQTLHTGNVAQLDGSGSSDADGDTLTYAWSFVSVPGAGTENPSAAQLNDPTSVTPSFNIDLAGQYVLQLIVNDGEAVSQPDTVTISTTNSPPVANAGPDQNLFMGQQAQLDGRESSDPDGDPITYLWSIIATPGADKSAEKAVLDDPTSPTPSFVLNAAGDFVVQLIVSDGELDSAPDTVVINSKKKTPEIFTNIGSGTELEMTVECGDPYVPPEITATDAAGNDITDQIVVGGDTVDANTAGVYVVTYDVSDAFGNVAPTVRLTVTVQDTTPPSVITRNITVGVGASGQISITAGDIDNGSSDNCGLILNVAPDTFSCANLGPNVVVLTGQDFADHVSTTTATVTVADIQPPIALAKDITVSLDAKGQARITAANVDNGSSDNCSVALSVAPDTFACADVAAPVMVTLTATDPGGNSSTAQALVTVVDALPPTAVAKDITVQLDANGQAGITPADIDDGSSDNCSVALSVAPNTFTCANVGTSVIVTMTVTDPSGNTDSVLASVTVADRIAPVAAAKNITVQLGANGQANLTAADVDNGSSDNCSVALSVSPETLTCADLGANGQDKEAIVTLTATDPSGNSDTAQATVTVLDVIAPTVRAKDITVQLDANGQATIVGQDVDNGSSDNCALNLSVSPDTFTCADLDSNGQEKAVLVTLTGTDPSGNANTAQATVTVLDTIAPVAAAKPVTVQLDANGQANITANDVDNGSTDNCAVNLSVSPNTFTCADTNTPVSVILTATDPSGNSDTAQALVTVQDTLAPTAVAKNITIQLDANGQASITAGDVDNGSVDNCSVALSVAPAIFTCADTDAPVSVTLTAMDPGGNTDTAQALVTVVDSLAPTAIAKNITVPLNANGLAQITGNDVDNGSTDNCGVILTVSPDAFTCTDLETPVAVTLTATDPNGNTDSAQALVTVVDTFAPTAVAKAFTVQLDTNGQAGITAADIDNGSTDNCSVALSVTPDAFDCADAEAPVTVTLTATDPSGNSDTAQALVTVLDEIAPTATAKDITVQLDANGTAAIAAEEVDNGSADNCAVALSVVPDTFTCADAFVGGGEQKISNVPIPVTLTVTDPSGNTDTAQALVTVLDEIAPIAAAKDITVQLDANGTAVIAAEAVDNGSTDNCGVALSVYPDTFTCADTDAPVTVTLTAIDPSGNADTAQAFVTVSDSLAPTAAAKDITVQLDANGSAAITAQEVDNGSTDNCSVELEVSPLAFSCADTENPVTVTLTATDPSGNTDTAQALVTIVDAIAPVAAAKDITVQLDADGLASIDAADIDNGSADNCSVQLSAVPDSFTCDDAYVGGVSKVSEMPIPVTLTVTDPSGNTDSAQALVTVIDAIAPTAIAKDITVQLDATGAASISAEDVDNGSSDNCSVFLSVEPDTFDCNDLASPVAVVLTATDPSGNTDTAQALVTVQDNLAPTAAAKNITVQLDANGQASIAPSLIDNGSDDNCSVLLDAAPNSFTCADVLSPVQVTLTATDPSGNTDTAQALVTVQDLIPPVAVADYSTSLAVFLDANGSATITPDDIDIGSSDNCSVELSVDPDTFTCADTSSPVLVTLTATDPSGNTATDTAMLMVLDSIYPTALAKDITVELDANGQAQILPEDVDNGSSDNCSVELSVVPDTFTCADLGGVAKAGPPVPVALRATDPSGLFDEATANVTVVDLLPPVITLNEDPVVVLGCGDSYLEEGATAVDNCDPELFVQIDASGVNPTVAGNYQVSYDAQDSSGNDAETVYRTVIVVGDCGDCMDSPVPPGTPNTCFGFEQDLEGFTFEDFSTAINLWHRSDVCPALTVPNDSSYVLYFGQDTTCDYDVPFEMMEGSAVSPVIDLTDSSGPVLLSFLYIVETGEGGYSDFASVQITTDNVDFTTIASSSVEMPIESQKLCDDGVMPNFKQSANSEKVQPPIWRMAVLDLSPYVGNVVTLQFRFSALDGSLNNRLGFAVDDICLYDYSVLDR